MSLEEEVNQSVSRAVSMAEAADAAAAAAAKEDEGPDSDELARLAPPAPDTVANGSVAPPHAEDGRPAVPGRPGLTSRLGPPAEEPQFDPLDGPSSGLLPPPDGQRGPIARPGLAPSGPPHGAGPGRHSSPQDSGPRSQAPVGTSPTGGLSDLFGDRDPGRGQIDPDEPTEGIRLLQ